MSFVYWIFIAIAVWFLTSRIEKYLEKRNEEKFTMRIEARINGMSQEERLSILNSADFKKWITDQMEIGMADGDMEPFKLLKDYMTVNFNKFF